jgi:trk system potassium uptake protein TrkA
MFVIIAGCSATGYHLAKLLMVAQHEVVVLEKSLSRCQLLWDELGSIVMHGDGTDLVDLRRAGITRADTVVAVTGKDETNLVICQMAKHAFSVARTVATIKDAKNHTVFRILGVDSVVNSGHLVLDILERNVVESRFNHLSTLHAPNTFLVSLTIPNSASAVGMSLAKLEIAGQLPENEQERGENGSFPGSFPCVVVRDGRPMAPVAELVLEAHDELFAVTTSEEEIDFYEKLTGIW